VPAAESAQLSAGFPKPAGGRMGDWVWLLIGVAAVLGYRLGRADQAEITPDFVDRARPPRPGPAVDPWFRDAREF
jgi:hypothetical protein